MKATIYSIYMSNIDPKVVSKQNEVISRLLPEGCDFEQFFYSGNAEGFFHANALEKCFQSNKNPVTVFLDIDCIPLSEEALTTLIDDASKGILTGAVQRANHIRNNSHLYVGPFCMAFLNSQYKKLGSPSFKETDKGDCAEELTYRWEEKEQPIKMHWPSDVYRPAWALTPGIEFGYGTTYENLFYHAFAIRQSFMQDEFIRKCDSVLATTEAKKKEPKKEEKIEKVEEKPAPVVKADEPKKTVSTDQEVKPREAKKEAAGKEEIKSK